MPILISGLGAKVAPSHSPRFLGATLRVCHRSGLRQGLFVTAGFHSRKKLPFINVTGMQRFDFDGY